MHAAPLLRGVAALAATLALVVAPPLVADAHVRLHPDQAVAGADDVLLTFSVPTESATAVTTEVVVDLPTATPFGDVDYQPVAGWSARVVTSALPHPATVDGATVTRAPTQVVWTADPGTRLVGGQFQDFVVSVGPVPDTGRIAFPTTQTYSDGSVVHWSQPIAADGDEPEHPAPVLYVDDPAPAAGRVTSTAVGLSAEPVATSSAATVGIVLGAAALVVAVLALVVALVLGLRLTRRPR